MYKLLLATEPRRTIFRNEIGEFLVCAFSTDYNNVRVKLYKPGLNFENDQLDIIPIHHVESVNIKHSEFYRGTCKLKTQDALFEWGMGFFE